MFELFGVWAQLEIFYVNNLSYRPINHYTLWLRAGGALPTW